MGLDIVISDQREEINRVISKVFKYLTDLNIDNEELNFKVELCLRELLANAIEHGCKDSGEEKIYIKIQSKEREQLIIIIKDPGSGFQWKEEISREMPKIAERGRGLPMVQSVVEKMNFNDQGNKVIVYLHLN